MSRLRVAPPPQRAHLKENIYILIIWIYVCSYGMIDWDFKVYVEGWTHWMWKPPSLTCVHFYSKYFLPSVTRLTCISWFYKDIFCVLFFQYLAAYFSIQNKTEYCVSLVIKNISCPHCTVTLDCWRIITPTIVIITFDILYAFLIKYAASIEDV